MMSLNPNELGGTTPSAARMPVTCYGKNNGRRNALSALPGVLGEALQQLETLDLAHNTLDDGGSRTAPGISARDRGQG